jgi:hypothetical protein
VNLTSGANYIAKDGTKVTCSAAAINKQTYCLCSSNNNLVLQEIASNKFNYLKLDYPDQASCLEDLKTRPECN